MRPIDADKFREEIISETGHQLSTGNPSGLWHFSRLLVLLADQPTLEGGELSDDKAN